MSYFWTNVGLDRNDLLVRGYQDGKRFQNRIPVRPHLYVDDKSGQSDFRSIDGKPVKRINFNNVKQIMDFRAKYEDTHGFNMYGLQTSKSWYYIYYDYLQSYFPKQVKYDASLINVAVLDIEVAADEGFPSVEHASKPVTAISVQCGKAVATFGCGEFVSNDSNVIYFKCDDEKDLLRRFVNVWSKMDIDVVTGWNVEQFDIPYLINRMNNLFGKYLAKKLSPWGMLDQSSRLFAMTGKSGWDIIGINVIDYLAAYKKFTYTQQESYSLDNIAHVELGERKLDYSEYDGLMGLYKNNFQKFIEYNIKDVQLVQRLDDKMKLLELMYAIAYDAKVNLNDAFTSVRLWDVLIHNYLIEKKTIVPAVIKQEKERQNVGGYVKDPIRGLQKWIVSFDLNSLYPHLIMQYNISPETYKGIHPARNTIDQILDGAYDNIDNPDDNTIGGSGAMYTKDFKGFLPALMERTYNDRLVWKKKLVEAKKKGDENEISRCNNMQLAKKIQLNSAYGALANPYFRWFKLEHAEAITSSGQLAIRWIEKYLNKFLNDKFETEDVDYVIAIDTDSVYITLEKVVTDESRGVDQLDDFVKDILEPKIDQWYNKLAKYVNAYEQKMVMKREVIADTGIWTAKKHYALNVWDNEGFRFKEPSLKVMGLESVRSSTPKVCRAAINSAVGIMLNENEARFIEFIENFKKEFNEMSFEEVAFPRGVSEIWKWSEAYYIEIPEKGKFQRFRVKKGCPIHVRGSITYNNMLYDQNLNSKYNIINQGEKIKFCYLKLPNPTREHVISVPNALPKQFGLDKYIDYDKQFEKSFLEPMKAVAQSAKWKVEKIMTLEDFWK